MKEPGGQFFPLFVIQVDVVEKDNHTGGEKCIKRPYRRLGFLNAHIQQEPADEEDMQQMDDGNLFHLLCDVKKLIDLKPTKYYFTIFNYATTVAKRSRSVSHRTNGREILRNGRIHQKNGFLGGAQRKIFHDKHASLRRAIHKNRTFLIRGYRSSLEHF